METRLNSNPKKKFYRFGKRDHCDFNQENERAGPAGRRVDENAKMERSAAEERGSDSSGWSTR